MPDLHSLWSSLSALDGNSLSVVSIIVSGVGALLSLCVAVMAVFLLLHSTA